MASTPHRRQLSRRDFLRLAGASGLSLAVLNGCVRDSSSTLLPPSDGTVQPASNAARSSLGLSKGGTIKWAEFYSTLAPETATALGIDPAKNREWMAGIVQQFEKQYPGWRVELEPMSYNELDQRSAIDFNADVPHDLVFTTPQLMARHRMIGDLLDLTPFAGTMAKKDLTDLNWSAAWQAAQVGGKQLGIPVALRTQALVFNRDLCRKAGVDLERGEQSLDKLVESAKKLTTPDGKTWGLALPLDAGRTTVETAYAPLVWHFGGDLYDAAKKTATLANEANRQAAQWLFDLAYQHNVTLRPGGSNGRSSFATGDALAQGEAAMALGFSSDGLAGLQGAGLIVECLPAARGCKSDGAGVVPLPTSGQAAFTGGRCLSIHSLSKQPEAAFELLQFILKPENLRSYPDAGLPVRLSTWQSNEYKSSFYQVWQTAARKGRAMPATPYYWELVDTVAAALASIFDQKYGVADALQRAEDQWNSRYAGE